MTRVPPTRPFRELIRQRVSVERFDPDRPLSERQIRELVEDAIQAPSSFNIQHWRFIAVRRAADRQKLCRAAYGQTQVAEAPVTFIVLGDQRGDERLADVMEVAVERGALPEGKAAAWIRMAREIYADRQLARDEAVRSGSLAAMLLMLAAEVRGMASGPLSGFDADRVRRDFRIDDRFVPVLLLAVGYPLSRSGVRQPRLSVDEVLAFDSGRDL